PPCTCPLSTHHLLAFFFILMPPHPPRPTLFPYTTLFRSHPETKSVRVTVFGSSSNTTDSATASLSSIASAMASSHKTSGRLARLDRKSTRLNSSHSQISYAVFCLKKKKKNT